MRPPLLLFAAASALPLNLFVKQQRTVLPWLAPTGVVNCSTSSCDPSAIAALCNAETPPSCAWGTPLPNFYIPTCAAGHDAVPNCINFPTLEEAQAACSADQSCTGLTSQDGGGPPWEMRGGAAPVASPLGEIAIVCRRNGSATPNCNAFDTQGRLFFCPEGACDCDGSADACARGRDIFSTDPAVGFGADTTDLYVLAGHPPPPEWADGIAAGTLLYGSPEAPVCYLPEVGNGYLATVPSWGSMHVGGLFNGACGTTEKARLPSPVALSFFNSTVVSGGLDMSAGVYMRRWVVGGAAEIEVRTWAHRSRRHVLVTDITLVGGAAGVSVNMTTLWDPTSQSASGPGNGCAGGFGDDVTFGASSGDGAPRIWPAATIKVSDLGERPNVTVALDDVPATLVLTAAAPRVRFIVAVAASIDFPGGVVDATNVSALALAEYTAASALSWEALWGEHVAAWAELNVAGIDVTPATADPGDVARAADVQSHARSSQYFLFSSLRDDHFPGISPGGLASQNYQGAVFMDADWWIQPPLYFLAPSLAASILQFRFLSIPVMKELAVRFGFGSFGGAMGAWTAAYLGNPFGCCDATGGYEDCLEHHISGDIAFSAWQYFVATGDTDWLGGVGWPLLSSIADYHLARVTPLPPQFAELVRDTPYHVNGVLPIDEWSVGSGCGSEAPGVNDDAQMNGVVKASLLLAAQAARLLGNVTPRSLLWDAVGANVVLLYNASHNHHDQFTSPTCPDGWGGSHYSSRHTVCPSDVEHLTYPLGDVLNTSDADARADAELFFPITCLENAGMTTPMHTIVWSQLGEHALAQAEFNRSLHAACYGPFNVRNEVDKHADIIGAHFDNSHFLTGDGGYLQALINGFGALRVTLDGLRLLPPSLPDSVGTLSFRNVAWRQCQLTVNVTATAEVIQVSACAAQLGTSLCIRDADGGETAVIVGGAAATLSRTGFAYPGLLIRGPCDGSDH